ncbi:DUF3159 domain-containing protein [Agromyces sp. ISL-38]|uniref:DUF3159 domain-containing protein n=1 Tax=Agromyces sp. ISL-38 TaxID=2819107 RepID=UPI001BE5504E|nr:DUF3159 domain-containing protein [Agromyces sp. ISL-38]MBT2499833.1 DUF3159 domain-containing protein [Agromyces sp. ISL-38]MBT2516031.1 DUF3159 domain-containing protein [Streptomyces sp. ISL-90]
MTDAGAERDPRSDERADAAASAGEPNASPNGDGATVAGDGAGEFGRQLAAAAERSGLGLARGETLTGRDLLGALGGLRGLAEAILPGLVFLVVYTFTRELVPSLAASLGLAVVFTIVRLARRSSPTQAIAGLIGVAASAALALWTGRAEDNYVLGFYTNAAYGLALLISLLVGWPLLGLIVGFLMGDGTAWRSDRRKLRAMQLLTLIWLGLFVARLVVQVPFYFAGNVEALGATRLLMGVPLYALVLVFSWLVVRVVYPSAPRQRE